MTQKISEGCVKKTQLDAQLILSTFHQTLHVSGVSRPIIRRYNRMYKTVGWIGIQSNQDDSHLKRISSPTRTTVSHLKRIISTNCCIDTVVPPDNGPR